ncbi:LacI family DNA-binding transcriptional regulator [Phytoactinopolyspora halotolerans]|uniref:LacI family transcriptional regulator n=1 Tax=Phytoactinopolyspora halotolerans TaxID=1981512 RepID=A0A6L9S5T3_9ACTN|nr:LacI family DNA-binding transcriptional regulator [Phytoactinopolyspora halotolerans]NED99429.1 LacI family transcriptional regulator [Phytoactinopolyspora halotolerans]
MAERDQTVADAPAAGRRVTIAQVADRAGVSATTVSHVLSGKRQVSAGARALVEQAVQELGYRPNHVARNLRTRRSQMLAVIIPDIANSYYTGVARGLADVVDPAGYGTYVCNTDGLLEREQKFIQDVLDRGVDGVAMASVHTATDLVAEAVRVGTPFVCLGGSIDHPEVDVITAADDEGSWLATSYLIRRGAQRVAMIAGVAGEEVPRSVGYRRALRDAGLVPRDDLTVIGDWTRAGGRDAMRELLSREPHPDAVFCANDLMAIGAMDVIRERGLSVPGDIALVGFDDVEAASLVTPALTTVTNPSYEAGRTAGELLLDRVRGRRSEERRTVLLPCRLVERESA